MSTNDNRAVALDAIKKAGFPQSEWDTALKVATAESGLNPRAVNNKNKNGTSDYGLFQINSIHKPTAQEKVDPYANARRAYRIWKDAGGKWTPWSAYNNGAWRKVGDKVGDVADGVGGLVPDVPNVPNPAGIARAAVSSVTSKVDEIVNIYLLVLIGLVLIILGILILSRDTATGAAVQLLTKNVLGKKGVAGKVAKAVK